MVTLKLTDTDGRKPGLGHNEVAMDLDSREILKPASADRSSGRQLMSASREIFEHSRIKYRFLSRGHPATEKLVEIAKKLQTAAGMDVPLDPFIFASGKKVNGFAIPDGKVFAWPELLTQLETEDEIAAFLAHEYVHILRGHAAKAMEHIPGKDILNEAIKRMGLSRVAETESDILAMITVLGDAGFNPLGMIEML